MAAGTTVAIVGASGSGKSTLLGLLAGLDTPSEGSVRLDGEDIYALDEDGRALLRKRKLGFVFQSFQLLGHLNALENVMLPLELRGDSQARAKAEQMLGRVGLGSRLKHYPKYLSGGEQQRVALARAFVTEPPLLFADEPTGSLDAATGESVIQLMFEPNRERGSTLVLFGSGASHRFDFDAANVRLRGGPVNPRRPRGCTLPQDAVVHAGTSYYWRSGQMVTLAANQCPPAR